MNIFLNLLRSDGSIILNKKLMREIGIEPTIVFSELLSKQNYYEERGRLSKGGYFYCTVSDLEYSTFLSKHKQTGAIKKLVELGLIDYKLKGTPPVRFFKVNEDTSFLENILRKSKNANCLNIEPLKGLKEGNISKEIIEECDDIDVCSKGESSRMANCSNCLNIEPLKVKELATNNTNINNTNNNTKDIYSKENKTIVLKDKDYHLERYSKDINDILRKNSTYRINKLYLEKYEDVFIDLFRIICIDISKPRTFGNKRKKALAKILKSFSFEEVIDVLVLVNKSDFLSGRVPNSIWKADLDWILQLEKFEQILNGKFNNRITTTGNLVDTAIVKAGEKMEDIEF